MTPGTQYLDWDRYNLEESDMTGEITLWLKNGPDNPRNSEGAFVTLADGRILFAYSRYYGDSWSDHATADIAARYSEDGGQTWSCEDRILVPNEGGCNVMSVSLLRLQDGRIALFYLRKDSISDCRPRLRTSQNEGETWSESICCIEPAGYFVVNNDRVIQLASGRLVIVAGLHRNRVVNGQLTHDGRSIMITFYSDDGGASWQEATDWVVLPVKSSTGLQEPGVVELVDSSLYAYCRTSTGCQWETRSTDQGMTWDLAEPSPFTAPASPLCIKRDPFTGQLVAVWNDHSGVGFPPPAPGSDSWKASWGRTPLVMAFSNDEGKSWERHTTIETAVDRGFCYTAIHFTENAILLAYCCGGPGFGSQVLQDCCIRRIPREE